MVGEDEAFLYTDLKSFSAKIDEIVDSSGMLYSFARAWYLLRIFVMVALASVEDGRADFIY